jgi:hypothetical protein
MDSEATEVAEADSLVKLLFYALVNLKSAENPQLGARMLEECYYID